MSAVDTQNAYRDSTAYRDLGNSKKKGLIQLAYHRDMPQAAHQQLQQALCVHKPGAAEAAQRCLFPSHLPLGYHKQCKALRQPPLAVMQQVIQKQLVQLPHQHLMQIQFFQLTK